MTCVVGSCYSLQATFDHVVSYASIYHLEKDEQCHLEQLFAEGSATDI